jgi:hypothetical protein
MGALSSSILSVIYLQYIEYTAIYCVLLRNQILGYFRYVDDILIVYTTMTKPNIKEVLNSFNDVTPITQFTVEEENNNQLNVLDITIKKAITGYAWIYTENRRPQISSSHKNPVIQWNKN